MATNYKLGPLPWSRETLIKAHWANWVATAEDIKEHPGCAAQEALQAVQMGIDLFVDNSNDLLSAVADYKNDAQNPGFYDRGNHETVERWDRRLRKDFFAVTSAAFALVDTYRSITKDFPVEGYDERKQVFADRELHHFMQGLRNYLTHKRLLTPSWQTTWTAKQKITELLLTREKPFRVRPSSPRPQACNPSSRTHVCWMPKSFSCPPTNGRP